MLEIGSSHYFRVKKTKKKNWKTDQGEILLPQNIT